MLREFNKWHKTVKLTSVPFCVSTPPSMVLQMRLSSYSSKFWNNKQLYSVLFLACYLPEEQYNCVWLNVTFLACLREQIVLRWVLQSYGLAEYCGYMSFLKWVIGSERWAFNCFLLTELEILNVKQWLMQDHPGIWYNEKVLKWLILQHCRACPLFVKGESSLNFCKSHR